MVKVLKILIFVVLLIFSENMRGQVQVETFIQLTEENGLSSGVVTCILKDSRGFMWFGTQNGLNKYDGYSFTTFYKNDSLPGSISGNYILALEEDDNGDIWVGVENGGLCKYIRAMDRFKSFCIDSAFQKDGGLRIKTIVKSRSGELYFGTGRGIYFFDDVKNTFMKWKVQGDGAFIDQLSVYEIYEDPHSNLWIGTNKGLFQFNPATNNTIRYVNEPGNKRSLSNNSINCIFRASNDSVYIGTNEGLNVTDGISGTFTRYYYNPDDFFSSEKSEVQSITEDGRGNLWIGSFGGGLIKTPVTFIRSAIYIHDPNNAESLSNDYVYSLFYDDTGIIWIGTYGGGINKIDQVKIRFDYLEHDANNTHSLISNDVYSVFSNRDETWIGTDNGLSILDQNTNTFTNIREEKNDPASLSNNIVYAILEDHRNNMWVGTASGGLNKLSFSDREAGEFNFIRFNTISKEWQKTSSDEILCLLQDQDKNIWAGTTNGIDIIKKDSIVASFQNEPANAASLADNEVYTIY